MTIVPVIVQFDVHVFFYFFSHGNVGLLEGINAVPAVRFNSTLFLKAFLGQSCRRCSSFCLSPTRSLPCVGLAAFGCWA